MFSRSETAFFHQPEVPGLIEGIANQESLVIYAGAGVSIDKTGLSWAGLVDNLLRAHMEDHREGGDRDEKRIAIMAANGPLQAASVVSQKYAKSAGEEWKQEIVRRLGHLLYVTRLWQRGELIAALARLGAAFYTKSRNFSIVTTNYDELIQMEVAELVNAAAIELDLTTSVVDHELRPEDFDVTVHAQPYRVVHLHGFVPKKFPNGSKNTMPDQNIILSELDYIRSQRLSVAVLTELFSKSSVLILGSSLTDQPLIEALARSSEKVNNILPRVAVMPLQGLKLPAGSAHVIEAAKDSIRLRMEQFKTDVVFPDFYCQVPQLLTELQVCINKCSPKKSYASDASKMRYGLRLDLWWTYWWRRRNTVRRRDLQREDYEYLEENLAQIRRTLKAENDVMKLEVWIRWQPSDSVRQLRLWASSTGSWPEVGSMREAEIQADSNNASVRAFCLGRPEIYPTDDDDGQWLTSDRWHTYLCVPIRIEERGGEIPVAVISLASMAVKDPKISEGNGVALAGLVQNMQKIGMELATPDRRQKRYKIET